MVLGFAMAEPGRRLTIMPAVIKTLLPGFPESKHLVDPRVLADILYHLADPLMVMQADQARNPGRVNAILHATDQDGENLLISVDPDGAIDLSSEAAAGQTPLARRTTPRGVSPPGDRNPNMRLEVEKSKSAAGQTPLPSLYSARGVPPPGSRGAPISAPGRGRKPPIAALATIHGKRPQVSRLVLDSQAAIIHIVGAVGHSG